MKEQTVEITFPYLGLDESGPFRHQRPGSTPDALNVRAFDAGTGRHRGAQRPGLQKYLLDQISGSDSIQEITHAVSDAGQSYRFGNGMAYCFRSGAGWTILDENGSVAYTQSATENHFAIFDSEGNYYVSYGDETASYTLPMRIEKRLPTGELVWDSTLESGGSLYAPLGMAISEGVLYVLAAIGTAATNLYLYRLDARSGAAFGTNPWLNATLVSWDRIGVVVNAVNTHLAIGKDKIFLIAYNTDDDDLRFQIITRSSGAVDTTVDVKTGGEYEVTDCCGDDSDNFYFCFANNTTGSGNANTLRKVDSTGATTWSYTGSTTLKSVCFDRMTSRLWAVGSALGGGANNVAIMNAATGAQSSGASVNAGAEIRGIRPDGRNGAIFSGLTNQIGRLDASLAETWRNTVTSASAFFMAAGHGQENMAGGTASTRVTRGIAVAGGDVVAFDRTGIVAVTSGTAALSATRPVVFASQSGRYIYFADGTNWKRYDPIANIVSTWSASAGTLPSNSGDLPRLICAWRGRVVLSGIRSDPFNWFMAKLGDPTDFNYGPATTTELQAVAGNDPRIGVPADIINCLCPLSDNLLLFGCDHSIYRMVGDPMSGGELQVLTDQVGMAWGRPFCRDPNGTLYFYGSRNGVFRMQPTGFPELISSPIDERLSKINLATTIVRLSWDDQQWGLHVYLTPLDKTQATTHYWWDSRSSGERGQSWWADSFENSNHSPKVAYTMDGDDPDDRVALVGSWDGYIRMFDDAEDDDDGEPILSHVVLGPMHLKGLAPFLLKDLQGTLASTSGTVKWAVRVGPNAEAALAASDSVSGTWKAGRNRSTLVRRYGHAAYIKVSQGADEKADRINGTWGMETLMAVMAEKGRQRIF